MSDVGQFGLTLALAAAFAGFFFGPIGRAIGSRIAGKGKIDPTTGLTTGEMTAERVAAMEDRILELEADRNELRERLEFTERVLPRGSDGQLPAGPP